MTVRFAISLNLIAVIIVAWIVWFTQHEERIALEILASREPDLAQPVYGQRVFSQLFVLPESAYVSGLVVPFYFPTRDAIVSIALRRGGKLVSNWNYQPEQAGQRDVRLDLTPPQLLDGRLELEIKGGSTVESEEQAPRVFVEPDDGAYPHGNYRIAANEKRGDIALSVIEQKTYWQLFAERWRSAPLGESSKVGYALVLAVVVTSLPYTVTRSTKAGI